MKSSSLTAFLPVSSIPLHKRGWLNSKNRSIGAINSEGNKDELLSLYIRQALHNFSDHFPVTLTLETPQTLSITAVNKLKVFSLNNTLISNGVLTITQHIEPQQTYMIFNVLGQKVHQFQGIQGSQSIENLNFLPPGLYLLSTSTIQSDAIKFVISR